MSKRVKEYVRDPSTGAGVNAVTVTLKKHIDGSTVTSDSTDSNGLAEMEHDTVGYPGPIYSTFTSTGTTRVKSGNVWGQIGGILWGDDIPDALQGLGIGVMPSIGNELQIQGGLGTMNVTVYDGTAILKDGVPYVLEASTTAAIAGSDPSNPRIDRVVLRLTREGQNEQGKIAVVVITGSPSGSPSAPSVTQSSSTWDLPLAQVLVSAGVTSIASDKVTDERTYCFRWPQKVNPSAINIVVGDGASVPTTGLVAYVTVPYTGTIIRNRVVADASGSAVFDIKKSTYSGFPTTSSICASAKPTLSTAQKSEDTTLTGWTTAVTAGDILEVRLDSVTTCKMLTLSLYIDRV